MSDLDKKIAQAEDRFSKCWNLIQHLQDQGVPDNSAGMDILAERLEVFLLDYLALLFEDPGSGREFNNIHKN
jgi:hypothetical protein